MNRWLIIILLVASSLRIFFLGNHMPSLYGDEISIGYNAWSVLKTGKDEFGRFLPIQFESWGDQKNPVYIYTVALAEIFFGLTAFAVRLPSALSGILAVLLTYVLVKQIALFFEQSPQNMQKSENVALIAALLLAISPWHIHISRGGYEANMALTLGLGGVYFFLKDLYENNQKNHKKHLTSLAISLICLTLSMYTYYTTKLFIPLLVAFVMTWGYIYTPQNRKSYLVRNTLFLVIFVVLCIPIIYLAVFSNGQARFARINIFSNPEVIQRVINLRSQSGVPNNIAAIFINKPYIWLRDFLEYYGDNFSPSFWFVAGDSSLRYAIGNHGMFYLIEAPFFLYGLLIMFQKNKKFFILLFGWLLLAVLPTALVGKSYGLRSLALLPVPMIFSAYGLVSLAETIKTHWGKTMLRNAGVLISILFMISFVNWGFRYIYIYPTYGYYWYDGMQQDAVIYPALQSKKYDHIFITKYYGKTEMYYAFYTGMDPAEYQKCSRQESIIADTKMVQCGNYYFGDIDTKNKSFEDLNLPPNSLVVGSPEAAFGNETILAKDDKRILFKIIK